MDGPLPSLKGWLLNAECDMLFSWLLLFPPFLSFQLHGIENQLCKSKEERKYLIWGGKPQTPDLEVREAG